MMKKRVVFACNFGKKRANFDKKRAKNALFKNSNLRCWGFGGGGDGVEAEAGVALFERPGLRERAVAGAEGRLAAVFGDDQRTGGEDADAADAAQQVEGVGVVGLGLPGRVEVDEVEELGCAGGLGGLFGEAFEEGAGAALVDGHTAIDPKGFEVGAECGEGWVGALGEEDVGCAAAERLDADGAGAGVEVGEAAAVEARREDVEEGLAQAVAGGTRAGAAGRGQLA